VVVHDVYLMRAAAARALSVCTPPALVAAASQTLARALGSASANARHGALLALLELVPSGLVPAPVLQAAGRVAADAAGGFVVRKAALDVLLRAGFAGEAALAGALAAGPDREGADGTEVGRARFECAASEFRVGLLRDWTALSSSGHPSVRLAGLQAASARLEEGGGEADAGLGAALWAMRGECADGALAAELFRVVAKFAAKSAAGGRAVSADWGAFALAAHPGLPTAAQARGLVVMAMAGANAGWLELLEAHASASAPLESRLAAAEAALCGARWYRDDDAQGLRVGLCVLRLLQDDDDAVRDVARGVCLAADGGQPPSLHRCLGVLMGRLTDRFAWSDQWVEFLVGCFEEDGRDVEGPRAQERQEEDEEDPRKVYARDDSNQYFEPVVQMELAARELRRTRQARLRMATRAAAELEAQFWRELSVKAWVLLDKSLGWGPLEELDLELQPAGFEARMRALLFCAGAGDGLDPQLHVCARQALEEWRHPALVRAARVLVGVLCDGGLMDGEECRVLL
jgi:hypothetical protein